MPRQPKVWWNPQKSTWCSDIGGKRQTLAKGKRNKRKAEEKLDGLLAEQARLDGVSPTSPLNLARAVFSRVASPKSSLHFSLVYFR